MNSRQQVPVPPTTAAVHHQKVRLRTIAEACSVPASQSRKRFAVLVRVKAPVYTQEARAPIDLVIVLDSSASMRTGLQQLKQGAKFVIRNLTQDDRLAMVTFGQRASQLSEFTHMSLQEKGKAITLVESMEAQGGVGTKPDLKKAYEVLRSRFETHRVGGIILITNGKDTRILKEIQESIQRKKTVLGRSFEESDKDIVLRNKFPTYTLGFGTNHDPRTLFYLARQGYGTYSFVNQSFAKIKDAMAICIGGLTSIVAQDIEITVTAAYPEVRITDIKRGLHDGEVSDSRARIRIKDLFGGEEKNFVVYVDIPEDDHIGCISMGGKTNLLTVTAEYSNPLIKNKEKNMIRSDEAMVYVDRPSWTINQGNHISSPASEVEAEVYRIDILDRVSRIWSEVADTSHQSPYYTRGGVKCWDIPDTHKHRILSRLEELLANVHPAVEPSAHPDMAALRIRLYNDLYKMKDGLPNSAVAALKYMLSWLSSHGWQRAATQDEENHSSFLTVNMQNLIASVEIPLASTAE